MSGAVGRASPPAGSGGFPPPVRVRLFHHARILGQDAPRTGRLEAFPASRATQIASCREHSSSRPLGEQKNANPRGFAFLKKRWRCFSATVGATIATVHKPRSPATAAPKVPAPAGFARGFRLRERGRL